MQQLIGAEAQHRPVHRIDALGRKIFDDLGQGGIDCEFVAQHRVDQGIRLLAQIVEGCCGLAEFGQIRLIGEFGGLLGHPQAVGNALQPAHSGRHCLQRPAQ